MWFSWLTVENTDHSETVAEKVKVWVEDIAGL